MTTKLIISTGACKLVADATDTGSELIPKKLRGMADFELCGDWSGQMLHLHVDAWIEGQGENAFYKLLVGGLHGTMHRQNEAKRGAPRYVGTLGPYREIQVLGWLRDPSGRWPRHIQLFFIGVESESCGITEEPILTI